MRHSHIRITDEVIHFGVSFATLEQRDDLPMINPRACDYIPGSPSHREAMRDYIRAIGEWLIRESSDPHARVIAIECHGSVTPA